MSNDAMNGFLLLKRLWQNKYDLMAILDITRVFSDVIQSLSDIKHYLELNLKYYDLRPLNLVELNKFTQKNVPLDFYTEHFPLRKIKKHKLFGLQRYLFVEQFLEIKHKCYGNLSYDEFIDFFLLQKDYPNSLSFFRGLINMYNYLDIEKKRQIYLLHLKYNNVDSTLWYNLTGRKYSIRQLKEIFDCLQTAEWHTREADLIRYKNTQFSNFYDYINDDLKFYKEDMGT